jgi:DNA-3-methyladenine glycosylase II
MRINIDPRGPFSLEVARTFACGLFSASRTCSADGAVRFAFTRDDSFELAGARLELTGGAVVGEAFGATPGIERQVSRIIGVDRDPAPFYAMAQRDPVLARLLAQEPGFRPVVFFSPWAAAGWSVLTQRLRMTQAARIAEALAREAGDVVEVDGVELASFPRPQSFLSRSGFRGLTAEKWSRLQIVAKAALDGELSLDALSREGARERLLKLQGVGPWTADAVLIRGVGPSDVLPLTEPSLERAVSAAYGPEANFEDVTARWAPFRTWASIMLIRAMRKQVAHA